MSPYVAAGKSVFFGSVWAVATGFSILTTQDLLRGGDGRGVTLDWSVYSQIFDLLSGKYHGHEIIIILGPWVVLAAYLVLSAVDRMVDDGIVDMSAKTFCTLVVAFDSFANWRFLSFLVWYYQILCTIVLYWVIMYWGGWCLRCAGIALSKVGGNNNG